MTRESRAVLAQELATCAALWPSLNAQNPAVLTAFEEALDGFSEAELRAGFRRVRQTHEGVSFPKPATVAALCGAARGRREWTVQTTAEGCDVKCGQCQTVTLYHELAADGTFGRLFPWHLDGCPLQRVDQPTDAASARLVWPQRGNGGRYQAPATALVQETARRFPAA